MLLAARRVGSNGLVIALELVPETFQTLLENIRANMISNVIALPLAAWSTSAMLNVAYAILNIHNKEDIGMKANMRVFEIPGAGGVEITDNSNIVSQYFNVGKEIITYYDLNDLIEKINVILRSEPEQLCDIARNGHLRVVQEHTYKHRAQMLAQTLGLRRKKNKGRIIGIRTKYLKVLDIR